MTFDEILAQIIDLLKRQGRVSYSALKRRFDLTMRSEPLASARGSNICAVLRREVHEA
jgi:hypothetical protein